jgi:predicted methyltransferase
MPRLALSCVTLLLVAQSVVAGSIPTYIEAAVNDTSRPDTDRQRDADRKPAEVISFAGMKPGDKVADFMPGRGYFAKIFCKLVGDTGHVYAISIPRQVSPPAVGQSSSSATSSTAASSSSSSVSSGNTCNNVTSVSLKAKLRPAPELHSSSDDPGWVYEYYASSPAAENFTAPEPLDMIWTSENYHDLHNKGFGTPDMLMVNKSLLAALKPGGILIIEDHAAAAGSGAHDTDTLHRIDPAQAKKEVLDTGFVFVGESKVLYHQDDPHSAKAHEMHDKTDRFLLKFRKP